MARWRQQGGTGREDPIGDAWSSSTHKDRPATPQGRSSCIAASGAGAIASPWMFQPSRAAGPRHQDRHDQPADRTDRRIRRGRSMGACGHQKGAGQGHHRRRRNPSGGDPLSRQPVEPEPGVGGRGAADQPRQGRHHDRLLDRRHRHSGRGSVRTRGRSLHHRRRSVGRLLLRPQGQSQEGFRLDLPFLLGLRHGRRPVRRHVAVAADQQEGGPDAHQRPGRHRRQQSGARHRVALQEEGARGLLSWALSAAQRRLHFADQAAQSQ